MLVIFGAGGDLTKRLLVPALYNLAAAKLLDDGFTVLGVNHRERAEDDVPRDSTNSCAASSREGAAAPADRLTARPAHG